MVTKISFFFLPGRLMTIVQLIVTIWNCSITLERSSIFENRKSSISIRAFNRSVKLRVLVVLLESLWVISMFLEDLRWFQHENFFSKFSRTISLRWEWFDALMDPSIVSLLGMVCGWGYNICTTRIVVRYQVTKLVHSTFFQCGEPRGSHIVSSTWRFLGGTTDDWKPGGELN